jgi:hypothetical protein
LAKGIDNMKYLIFILTFSAYANYIPKNLVGVKKTGYLNKDECETYSKSVCLKIPENYNFETFEVSTAIVDGKPFEYLAENASKKAIADTDKALKNQKKGKQNNFKIDSLNKNKQDKLLEMMMVDFLKKKDINPDDL